jgi:hypothetical protein
MADEEKKKEEEQHSLNPTLQDQHIEALENKARTKGWRPLEEWHGEPEDWVDAKEFIGREKLFDRIADLKSQLHTNSQKFDKDFQVMANHFAQMRDVEYKRALAELKSQLSFAKDEKDVDSVEKLTAQVAAVEQERKIATLTAQREQQSTTVQADPEKFRKFKQENGWFDKDKEMQEEAMSIGIGYSATHKEKSQEEVYDYVVKRIKKIYPEKFEMAEEDEQGAPNKRVSAVEGSTPSKKLGAGSKKGKLTVGDLDEREKEVMKTFIKRGVLTQEKYLEDLAKARGL